MMPKPETKVLSRDEIKLLLSKAKETNEHEWAVLSFMIATGKRGSHAASTFSLTAKDIVRMCKEYSGKVGYELTPHMIRKFYAIELQDLGVHPDIIEMFLGHRPLETEKKE